MVKKNLCVICREREKYRNKTICNQCRYQKYKDWFAKHSVLNKDKKAAYMRRRRQLPEIRMRIQEYAKEYNLSRREHINKKQRERRILLANKKWVNSIYYPAPSKKQRWEMGQRTKGGMDE